MTQKELTTLGNHQGEFAPLPVTPLPPIPDHMNLLTMVSGAVVSIAITVLVITVVLYAIGKIRDFRKSRNRKAPLGEATDWAPVFLKPYQPHSSQEEEALPKAPPEKKA